MTLRYPAHFLTIVFIHALILFGGWQISRDPKLVSNAVSSVNATIVRIATASKVFQEIPVIPKKTLPSPKVKSAAQEQRPQDAALTPESAVSNTNSSGISAMARADLRSMFLGELRARIEENKTYPMMSRRLGQTGIVEVAFTLTRDGHIINARIVSPSRYDRLNESALDAVKKITRFRPIPNELNEERMDVTVPVKFAIL
jgi:protein TonB